MIIETNCYLIFNMTNGFEVISQFWLFLFFVISILHEAESTIIFLIFIWSVIIYLIYGQSLINNK